MEFMILGIVIGLAIGGVSSWFVRSTRAKSEAATLQAGHREEVANLQGQLQQAESAQAIVDAAKEQLNDVFQSTASKALQGNNEQFLQLAQQNLGTAIETAKSDFEKRHVQFQELVKPLSENYGKLNPQIETLTTQVQSVSTETARLASALSDNQAVGNWGEVQLRRVVEIAGMTSYCEFQEQVSIGGSKPDMVISLPESRSVVVDAKASTAAYLEAQQSDDELTTSEALTRHANALKSQVDDLARKNYGSQVPDSLDFVVMFVPGDQFLAAALRAEPGLVEHAMSKQVAIATPASLIAMLWAIQNGWQQVRFAESAREIRDVGEEMHKRMLTFISRYQNVGRELNSAVTAFNSSIGSFDSRVVPQGRRFSGLVTGNEDSFRVPTEIDQTPRISRYASRTNPDTDGD